MTLLSETRVYGVPNRPLGVAEPAPEPAPTAQHNATGPRPGPFPDHREAAREMLDGFREVAAGAFLTGIGYAVRREKVTRENARTIVSYHKPTNETVNRHHDINLATEVFIKAILAAAPDSGDRDEAIKAARLARAWANSAIALNGRI